MDKKNGNPKKNIANKNIVEEPTIPSDVNTISQLESGIKEVRIVVLSMVLLNEQLHPRENISFFGGYASIDQTNTTI